MVPSLCSCSLSHTGFLPLIFGCCTGWSSYPTCCKSSATDPDDGLKVWEAGALVAGRLALLHPIFGQAPVLEWAYTVAHCCHRWTVRFNRHQAARSLIMGQ